MIPAVYSGFDRLTNQSRNNNGLFPSLFFTPFLFDEMCSGEQVRNNDFFNDSWLMPQFHSTTPAINVSEDDKEYKVEVAAPGMTKDDFKITLSNDDIVISMEKKSDNKDENKDKKYIRREFFTLFDLYRSSGEQARSSYSKFEQRLTLPENVERKNISAQMTDGVLRIDLPKMASEEKAPEAQYIEIK